MKKFFSVLALGLALTACNNSSSTDEKVDSLNARKDTLINNIDSTVDAKVDSLKENGTELKEKFDSTIDAKKDSVKGKQ
ncbi:MAG: hypothetical protein ACTHOF_09265 [Flavisolibacter sp.]|jgi:hypothetical protein